jgi:hypothetical protein
MMWDVDGDARIDAESGARAELGRSSGGARTLPKSVLHRTSRWKTLVNVWNSDPSLILYVKTYLNNTSMPSNPGYYSKSSIPGTSCEQKMI